MSADIPPTAILSRTIYLIVVVAAIGFVVFGWKPLQWLGVAGTIVFLGLEVRHIPLFQALMAVFLVSVGIIVGVELGDADPVDIALSGIAKAQIFLVLFFAIQWLQTPASVSPALHAVRRTVVSQPPGRRFLYLAASGHILGSVLNVAGLVLLSTMVERQKDALLQRRMASALMQNYIVASTWSPFFISVVVILIALPELSWLDVVTGGLPMALIAVGVSWLHDRIRYRPRALSDVRSPSVPLEAPHGRNLTCVFATLIVLVIGTVEWSGLSLPVVLGFVGPLFGMFWMALIEGPTVPPWRSAWRVVRRVYGRIEGLRSEALAFTASSIVGVGFATGFPMDAIVPFAGQGGWIIFGLIFAILGLGFLGIHPLVSVIVISEAVPPTVLGMPVQVVGLSLLGVWGLTTLVSPVSGTTLIMARFVPASSYTIAWRWSPPYTILAAVAIGLFVYAVWRMELY